MNTAHKFVAFMDKATKTLNKGSRHSMYGDWLRVGREMKAGKLTLEQQEYLDSVVRARGGYRQFKMKQCYMNSQLLVVTEPNGRMEYCEGFWADTEVMLAMPHAWVLLDGKLVDLTALDIAKKHPDAVAVKAYFGVTIPLGLVRKHMAETEVYDALTEHPRYAPKIFGTH